MKRVLFVTILFVVLAGAMPVKADEELEKLAAAIAKQHRTMHARLKADWERRNEEIRLLAEVIYWENWHTDKDHLTAYYTGAVVMNRVKSPKWPPTVKEVLYQKGQYSTTKYFFTKELPSEVYDLARDIYYNGTPDVPYDVVFQATFEQGFGDWIDPINGEHFCYGRA